MRPRGIVSPKIGHVRFSLVENGLEDGEQEARTRVEDDASAATVNAERADLVELAISGDTAEDRANQLVGKVLVDRLRVVRRLGSGAMGDVYEVEHLVTGHQRALKVLREAQVGSADAMRRFLREARVAATLKTPYVVETVDAGLLEDGRPFVLMELLEGQSLSDRIRQGRVGAREALAILRGICEGVAVAHRAGIVHRDLKPENVFLCRSEGGGEPSVKILDFGISKFTTRIDGASTHAGAVLGTPFYMSPEQWRGESDVDERSDIYAIGVIAYELLSGKRPYIDPNLAALLLRVQDGNAVRVETLADVDATLADVVHRAMCSDRSRRHGSIDELARDLRRIASAPPAPRDDDVSDTVMDLRPERRSLTPTGRGRGVMMHMLVLLAVLGPFLALAFPLHSSQARRDWDARADEPPRPARPRPIVPAPSVIAGSDEPDVIESDRGGATATPHRRSRRSRRGDRDERAPGSAH